MFSFCRTHHQTLPLPQIDSNYKSTLCKGQKKNLKRISKNCLWIYLGNLEYRLGNFVLFRGNIKFEIS